MMSKDMGSGPTVLADTHSGQLGAMFPSQGGSPGRQGTATAEGEDCLLRTGLG